MKNNEHDISNEIYAVTGRVVTRLLSAGGTVTPEMIIQALYQLSETTDDDGESLKCLELIKRLLKNMH